ncbi:MAG: serine/threonine protein kinase [Burkholderiaceae bacterium]
MPTRGAAAAHPYDRLTPPVLLAALDASGVRGDGRLLQLNSYENRVFQVMLEDGSAVVAKFYRPARWSSAQILEEHRFALELAAEELPVIAPQRLAPEPDAPGLRCLGDPPTLAEQDDGDATFRWAVYPMRSGHGPEIDSPQVLQWLGRFVGRMHAAAGTRRFAVRRTLDPQSFGHDRLAALLATDALPDQSRDDYRSLCAQALQRVDAAYASLPGLTLRRVHGDLHPGNILWRDAGPHVVDLDDCCNAPAVQDLWMLLSGTREAMRSQLVHLLDGYRSFTAFDARELTLIEPLRTLRMVHYSAWLAERWADPAFPVAFPWFGTPNYWQQQMQQLREQIAAMDEPPLAI